MFERFTSDARATVVTAQEVARRRGAASIDTVHLLLALAAQDGIATRALTAVGVTAVDLERLAAATEPDHDLDADALAAVGIDLDAVRARTDAAFGPGALDRAGRRGRRGHVPFTKEAKKTLELSLREAVHEGSRSIDSGHVLLALLRVDGTTAHRTLSAALAATGSDQAALRAELERGRAGESGRAAS
ncbi:Clp protease N-terminal domain-containing protein [Cellulosimicrobium sp. Marseille-Q8652]